ncbi:MAG TPA: SRPBCC family protein [Pseudomonadales bacterium]
MTVVDVTEKINGPADAVWKALSDFGGIKVGGPVTSVAVEGKGVGMIRTIGMGGGEIIERLDRHDAAERIFSYCILNDDCPLPVSGYSATVKVTDNGDGTSTVSWQGRFEPRGDEAQARTIVEGIYRGGIAGARRTVGG